MSLSLSTVEMVRLIVTALGAAPGTSSRPVYEVFVDELMENKFLVPNVYKGWKEIDSIFCVVLLHYAVENVRGRTVALRSFPKEVVVKVLTQVYARYMAVCQSIGLPFVPCMKGLATVLQKGKK